MDPLQIFSSICSAFGLSGAAGLNAYIPLLTIAIMQRSHVIQLAKPYDIMGEWWVIGILAVLLVIEIVVDKVPGADHVNDIIQTAIRPSAGALIFASQMGHVSWVHPGVWLVIGIIMSGGVHVGKAVSRPVINVGTAGLGAPVASVVEDLISSTLSVVAIFVPVLAVILMIIFGWLLVKLFRKFFGGWRKDKRVYQVRAVPVKTKATVDVQATARQITAEPAQRNWSGGV
ncbi:MAG TPA: DUF4126 domain-containing protein [Phycisphaerae bacterium]